MRPSISARAFSATASVVDLIIDKLPVSISIGLWTTLITYLVSIPLGIPQAVRDGSQFDVWTSGVIIFGYAVPSFLFAVLLIVLFAGGSYWSFFPLRGLVSDNWAALSWPAAHSRLFLAYRAADHGAGDRQLRDLDDADEEFLSRRDQQAIRADRARQGLTERRVLYGSLPQRDAARRRRLPRRLSASVYRIATDRGDLSLDGLGLLGFEAAINRDYPIMFGTLYVFTLIGLVLKLVSDLTYMMIDPRIDFERRAA